MRKFLSVFVFAILLSGGWMGTATASGTCEIPELCEPVRKFGVSLRAADIVRTIGIVLIGLIALGAMYGHIGAGFATVMGSFIMLGVWFQAEAIADAVGWSAIGF